MHPNIVPLLGVTIDPPQLISDLMSGATLTEYIANHSDADRLGLVGDPSTAFTTCLPPHQLSDVTEGLNFLHSYSVIHGDLKGVSDCLDLISPRC